MNLKKIIMAIIPKQKNWLSDNIASIIALSFIWFTFYVFRLVLLKEIKTSETTTISIINSITNILMLIVGYYFGSSKSSRDKDKLITDPKTDIDITQKVGMFLIMVWLLTGCTSQRKIDKICSKCPVKVERHDSIIEKIVEVPVLVPGKPGPTVFLENPCKFLCDSNGNLKKIDGVTKKNNQNLSWKTKGNGIEIAASTEDTTIKASVKSKESFSNKVDTVVRYEDCKRDHRNAFDGFCRWYFYISAPILLLIFGFKYLKRYFKI